MQACQGPRFYPPLQLCWFGEVTLLGEGGTWCLADLEYWLMWEIWVFQTSCQSLRSLQSHGRVTALCSGCGRATLSKLLMSSCLRQWVLFFALEFQVWLLKVRSGSPAIKCNALFYGPQRAQPDGCTLHPHWEHSLMAVPFTHTLLPPPIWHSRTFLWGLPRART